MEMKINLNGKKRKILADAIGELLEVKAEYKSVPSFSYEIGEATLNRDNTLLLPPAITPDLIRQLIDNLDKDVHNPIICKPWLISIIFSPKYISNSSLRPNHLVKGISP